MARTHTAATKLAEIGGACPDSVGRFREDAKRPVGVRRHRGERDSVASLVEDPKPVRVRAGVAAEGGDTARVER